MELCLQLLLFLPTNNIKSFLKTKCFCRQLRLILSCFRFTTSFLEEPFPALSLVLNPVFSLKMFHLQLGWHAGSLEGFVGLTKRLPVALSPNNNLFQIEVGGRLCPNNGRSLLQAGGTSYHTLCRCSSEGSRRLSQQWWVPNNTEKCDLFSSFSLWNTSSILKILFHC